MKEIAFDAARAAGWEKIQKGEVIICGSRFK